MRAHSERRALVRKYRYAGILLVAARNEVLVGSLRRRTDPQVQIRPPTFQIGVRGLTGRKHSTIAFKATLPSISNEQYFKFLVEEFVQCPIPLSFIF